MRRMKAFVVANLVDKLHLQGRSAAPAAVIAVEEIVLYNVQAAERKTSFRQQRHHQMNCEIKIQ